MCAGKFQMLTVSNSMLQTEAFPESTGVLKWFQRMAETISSQVG